MESAGQSPTEEQQQQLADGAQGSGGRDAINVPQLQLPEVPPPEQEDTDTNRGSKASAPLPPLAPLSAGMRTVPTPTVSTTSTACAFAGVPTGARSLYGSPSSVTVPLAIGAAASSNLRTGNDADGGDEKEGEEGPLLTNGSIALAEFTSLLKPSENNTILKEHIIHLLRDVDTEETLMFVARALETQEAVEAPVDVSTTTWTGSSRDAASYANASQCTATSMSMTQRRRSSLTSRRDVNSLEALAGLSFLHSRRRTTSPSTQDSPSSTQPSEEVGLYNRSTRDLGGPMDVSFSSRSSLGIREEERRQSKPHDELMEASASQLSEATATVRDDPLLRESPALPTAVRREGRRVAVSAAPCMPPPEMMSADVSATVLPPLRVVLKTAAEEQQLRRLLRRCHSFSSLEADTLEGVLKAMDKEVHAAGAAILEQGQTTTEKFYLVGEGTCEAIKNGKSLGPLQPGGTFGELELMYKQAVCAATIRCVTRCVLYTLDEASYHRAVMTSSLQKRRKFEKLTMNVPFLRCLPDFERMKIAEALETRVYKRGEAIIRFGSPGNYMHFIVEGEVKVVGRNRGRRVEVVRLRDGDVVGELEFLFNHLTVADVVATSREVRTAYISREHFELILGPIQDRLKEFVATSSTYENYYVSEVADESVRSELNRIGSSRKHRRVASHDQSMTIEVTDPRGEVLLSAPLALIHGRYDTAGKAGGVGSAASGNSTAGDGADAHGQRGQPAWGSAQQRKALLRFPFSPITGKDVAVLALREDGLIIYWNSALEKLTRYCAEEVVGQSIYSFLLSEREQQSMYKAVNAARSYAGESEAFLKRSNTKSIQLTLARSDGLTKTTIRLTIVPPVVSAGGNAAEVVLGFGEEVKEGPQKMLEQPQWLSGQIRVILADGTQTFEERLESIAETLNNFEATYRAMTVSTERLRVVNIRQMMGHVLMDFGGECVSRGISVRQRFEGLPSERAYLDADLLPECLRYAMKLCVKYSDPGGSIVTITITVTEKNGLEFLVVNFNLAGDGMPKAIAKFFDSPLNRTADSCTTTSVDLGEGNNSDDDGDSDAEESVVLQSTLPPRLRRKLRRVQRAVEDQGGTLRMLRNPHDSNIAFLIPFMPASEQDAENASVEESLSTLADSIGASPSASLAGMGSGIGAFNPAAAAAAAGEGPTTSLLVGDQGKATGGVSLANTSGGEGSGLSNLTVGAVAATAPGQPAFNYTTCLAEDTPAHRIMLSSFLWERHHAVLTAFTFEDVVGLVGVADILIIDLQQSAITSFLNLDPIIRLREMLRHMAVIITSTSFDLVSCDTYADAGFITLKKPCTPVQAMRAIRCAEEKSAVMKLARMRIEQTRETLARNSRGAWRHGALLGKGSSGEVYEAYDVLTGGKMAVKEMRVGNNDAKIEQFVQEISTMCNLQHPNIIHYFYCEENKEQKVIRVFMEFAGGGTLQSLLKKKGRLEYGELRALLRDVVEGLAYIHSQHYVHGDIKTANVLLSNDGKGKIGDFGTARTVQEGELLYVMQGSPLYMSPECMSAGEEDEDGNKIGYSFPSDIWSLGCVAMEMATNKPPFAHIKTIKGPAGLTKFITSLTDVPDLSPLFKCHPSVVEFVSACLNPDPSQRATAQDLLQMSLFSESTHGDRNSAVKALKRAQLLHVLNKFVAFQEPLEAHELGKQRNRFKVSQRPSDFFSSTGTASSGNASELTSTPFFKLAPAAEVEEAADRRRRRGAAAAATAAVAGGDDGQSGTGAPRRSDTVALAERRTPKTPGGARSAREPSANTAVAADGSLDQAASTFTRYLRKWDFSSSRSSASSEGSNGKAEELALAGGEGGEQLTPPRHRDPFKGVAGENDEAEPDARNPQTEDADYLSPTPKNRSTTRSRPQAASAPPVRESPHQSRGRGSTTTTNSAEEAFFATSSDSSSNGSGRASHKVGARSEAIVHQGKAGRQTGTVTTTSKGQRPRGSEVAGYVPSFPGRRRNVTLDEAGNIVPFERLPSMTSVAAPLDSRSEPHGDGASTGGGARGAAAAVAEVAVASHAPLCTLSNANDTVMTPNNVMGPVSSSFAQPSGNFSFFNYSFNKNISFMGANMDEVLNSAANDFLSNLAANSHANNAAGVETASSAGSTSQPPSRALLHVGEPGSARSCVTLSSNKESEGHIDGAVRMASPRVGARGHSEDRGDAVETPSRQRGSAISRSPSARNPLDLRGQDESVPAEGGSSEVQRGGATLPRLLTPPPKPPSMAAVAAAASRSTCLISSRRGSASVFSDDGTASITPRGDSVPLVGAAASPRRQRRVRPPITNQSFFVVEDWSSTPSFGGSHATPVTPFPRNSSTTKMIGSNAGGRVSFAQGSLTTLSSVASAEGSVVGGAAGNANNSTLLQQHYANVAVVAPPPPFSANSARTVWQQQRRRRRGAGGRHSGAGGSSMSNIHLSTPLSNADSAYMMVTDEHQYDGQRKPTADAAVTRECDGDVDDEGLVSAAFSSMHSGFSRYSSIQSAPYLTAETLSTAHEQVVKRHSTRSGDVGAFGSEDRRSDDAQSALLLSSLPTQAASRLFAYLERIDQSLQDVVSQLQMRCGLQQQQQHDRRGESGSTTAMQDSFEHAPPSIFVTTLRATLPQSAAQTTTFHSSLNSTLLSLAPVSSASDMTTAATVPPRHRSGVGTGAPHAALQRPFSCPPAPAPLSIPKQVRAGPLSMQHSNPLRPREDDAEAERNPAGHDDVVLLGTPRSPSVSGHCTGSGGEDVNIEALMSKMLRRVNLLLDEVSHLSLPMTSSSSSAALATASVAHTS
ncbi:hypothetical protein LSCM4_07289 [Leishmania orientalis]|uniref:Protein kinase n=1 Tax=Leishmania orientalis TaxID=2249476 RepID=A0A836GZK2_9TRYP|nr:hypothetical protein LSCM4_07289 [Leishmania orientalis]